MTCHHCEPARVSLAEADDDLRDQIADAPSALKPLIRSVRDRLRVQDKAAATLERDLAAIYREVLAAFEETVRESPTFRARILAGNARDLRTLLERTLAASMADAQRTMADALVDLVAASNVAVEAASGRRIGLDVRAFQTLVDRQYETFWQGKVVLPAADVLLDGITSATTAESLTAATERIAKTLDTTAGRAATNARTNLATFDRTVAEESATRAGLDLRWYAGPEDGLTRPFCRALVGKVLTLEQVRELDNDQTPASPLFSAGGYNCRHRLVAVDEDFAADNGLPMATDSDIAAANLAARGD